MRLEDDIDFTTLNWVKQELDDTLRQARQALEAYVEDASDPSQLRFCASFLHQVQGTLRMVELYGAAMVMEEMERLVQGLLDGDVRRRDDAYGVLMRGIVQMPDYLERLQGGHKDIPIVLLPLLNDLRACRGEKLLSESVLFSPDLAAPLPMAAEGRATPMAEGDVRLQAAQLRVRYQAGLLAWIKNEDSEPALTGLIDTLDELRALSSNEDTRRLWWVAAGLLDAARQRAVDIGTAVKLLFGKVDREIKRVADGGEQAITSDPPRQLLQNLLYYLAHGEATGARVESIRETYGLQDLLPTQAELDHAKGSLGGKNRALLDTVSVAIKEDLLRVKDTLDLYLRRSDAVPAELSGQAMVLDRVADTLGMLGLGVPRRVVQEQRRVLDEMASGTRAISESSLLDVAGALLYVEVSLDENIRTLGVAGEDESGPILTTDPSALPKAEVKRILDALLRESIANVQRAKADIVAYVESGWESGRLDALPAALEEIVGAMRMLDQKNTAELVDALSRFVDIELLQGGRVPTSAQVDHLADAFTSLEYYLEASTESRAGREQILDVTRESLAALGYWPPPSPQELQERDEAGPVWTDEAEGFAAQAAADDVGDEAIDAVVEYASQPAAGIEIDDSAAAMSDEDPIMGIDIDLPEIDTAEPAQWSEFESIAQADLAPAGEIDLLEESTPYPRIDAADGERTAATDDGDSSGGIDFPEGDFAGEPDAAASGKVAPPADAPAAGDDVADGVPQDPRSLSAESWPDIGDSIEFDTAVMGQSESLGETAAYAWQGGDGSVGEEIEVASLSSEGFDDSLRMLDDALRDPMAGDDATRNEQLEGSSDRTDATVAVGADMGAGLSPATETGPEGGRADSSEWIEIEEEVEEEIQREELDESELPVGFDVNAAEDIDDDIRDVFIEEVTEEIANIGRMLPILRSSPDDVEALRNVRRSFHTLKGSGRLVGALALGEFAWRVETMLNRVLDHTVRMESPVLDLLDHSRVALDQLRTELRGMGTAGALPLIVMQAADNLVAGESGVVVTTRKVVRTRRVPVPLATSIDAIAAEVIEAPSAEAPASESTDEALLSAMQRAEHEAAGVVEAPTPDATGPVEEVIGEGDERMPAIEPLLLEVLRSEAGGYLGTLESWIELARGSGNRTIPDAELLRAVHTLHGALGMVEVPVVAEVVGLLEGYLKRLVGASIAPSADGLEAMGDVSGVVGATLSLLDRPGAAVPRAGDLNDRLAELRDALPEAPTPTLAPWEDEDDAVAVADVPAFAGSDESAREVEADHLRQREALAAAAADSVAQTEVIEAEPDVQSEVEAEVADRSDEVIADEVIAAELLGDVAAAEEDADPLFIEPESVEHDLELLDELPSSEDIELEDAEALVAHGPGEAHEGALTDALESPMSGALADDEAEVEAAAHSEDQDADAIDSAEAAASGAEATAAGRGRRRKSARRSKRERLADELQDVALDADAIAAEVEVAQTTEEFDVPTAELEPQSIDVIEVTPSEAEDADEPAFEQAEREVEVEAEISEFEESLPLAAAGDGAGLDEADVVDSAVADERAFEQSNAFLESDSNLESASVAWQDEVDPDQPLHLPDLDDDLLDIFVEEAREILDQADPDLAAWRANPESVAAVASLQRYLHTIKGNGRAVGLMGIGDLSHALETLIDSPVGRTDASIELVQRGFDRLHRMTSRVASGRDVAFPHGLISVIEARAAGLEIAAVDSAAPIVGETATVVEMPGIEQDPIEVEAEFAHDRLALGDEPVFWRPAAEEAPAAGIESSEPETAAEELEAFAASDAFVAAFTDEDAASTDADRVIEPPQDDASDGSLWVDQEADDEALAAAASADADRAIAAEIESEALAATATSDAAEMAAAAELDVADRAMRQGERDTAHARDEADSLANVVRLDDYRLPAQVVAPEDAAVQRQSQELIRVRADLLDSLVNYAGEVSIYRSRLEQQLGLFRANVVELEQTVERTREQLRKLELETETQIIARFQREAETDEGTFDPLELDRFSTLQQLSRALAESVSDLVSLHGTLDDLARQQETLLLQQSRVASELQQGLMRTRMVPFETQVPFLRRLVRQSADEMGKRAQLLVEGAQGEMDRNLLERMKAPLEHMLRNALAHGIESPDERSAQGKSGEGSVRIEVAREASEVLIRVADDGRGLNREAIRRKAVERGLMRSDSPMADHDLFAFITETGFSTADTVSKLAGRGVGMDVVANEIRELGGSLSIDSEAGVGSRFTIRLPFTLAVTQAIMVRLGDAVFAVPMSSVQGVARLPLSDFEPKLSGKDERLLSYGGEDYAVHDLALLLGTEPNRVVDSAGQLPLLLVRSGDQRAAIRVDTVVGSREIVVKSPGTQIASVPGMFGATIMGDGSVVMILDLAPLVRRHIARRAERAVSDELAEMLPAGLEATPDEVIAVPVRTQVKRQPLIMVVDDSITMRKVTSRVLERQDMEVVTAKDGLDAVEKLQERVPDMAILDIEMPRMDGYELATYIRNDPRLRHLPLMMITSRTGEKHRQRAFEIGVDRFLGKPYQEADLLRTVLELLGENPDE